MAAAIAQVIARVSRYHAFGAYDLETVGLLVSFGLLGLVLTLLAARFSLDISHAFF
jgi:hypothetical protein